MKVSDFILDYLADQGVTHVPMVYGGAISELMDAFTRTDRIKHIVFQHEQAAGFAAEGYAKASGKIGVVFATSGPGAGNLITCIQNSYFDSVPMLFIVGNVNSKFQRPDENIRQLGFQECPIVDMVKPITKFAKQVRSASINEDLEKAVRICKEGRRGAVLLDIPVDIQKELYISTPCLEAFEQIKKCYGD